MTARLTNPPHVQIWIPSFRGWRVGGGWGETSFLEMNNTYPSIASVALSLRFHVVRHRRVLLFPPVKSALIGHSMSKGIKRRQPSLHRLLLAVAINYFN